MLFGIADVMPSTPQAASNSMHSKLACRCDTCSEILDFVMGTGLIPADGEVWRSRRRAIVPALHKRYVASMVSMFGACTLHGAERLEEAAAKGELTCFQACCRGTVLTQVPPVQHQCHQYNTSTRQ